MHFRYDDSKAVWKAKSYVEANFLATSKAPRDSLLIGSYEWNIHNDTWCNNGESYER